LAAFIFIFSISLVHKHITNRISPMLFFSLKFIEISGLYLFVAYLERSKCFLLATLVHTAFDLSVYNVLLDFLASMEFKVELFEFEFEKEGTKENIDGKIIFNATLLLISYASTI
jgi:hypothetical protein